MIRSNQRASLAACIAVLGACASGDKQPPVRDTSAGSASVDSAAADTTQATELARSQLAIPDTAPPLIAGFHHIAIIGSSSMASDTSVRQRMITPGGWVYAEQEHWNSDPATPEIVVRADSSTTAPMVAYIDYWLMHAGGFDMIYAVRDSSLQGEMDCVRSEVMGMAAVKVVGSWAQVIYGYSPSGEARLGWVKLVPGKVVFTDEQEELDE